MYVCVWDKFIEYGITSWQHKERTHDYKCNITYGFVGHFVYAGQTSDSSGRFIV